MRHSWELTEEPSWHDEALLPFCHDLTNFVTLVNLSVWLLLLT